MLCPQGKKQTFELFKLQILQIYFLLASVIKLLGSSVIIAISYSISYYNSKYCEIYSLYKATLRLA